MHLCGLENQISYSPSISVVLKISFQSIQTNPKPPSKFYSNRGKTEKPPEHYAFSSYLFRRNTAPPFSFLNHGHCHVSSTWRTILSNKEICLFFFKVTRVRTLLRTSRTTSPIARALCFKLALCAQFARRLDAVCCSRRSRTFLMVPDRKEVGWMTGKRGKQRTSRGRANAEGVKTHRDVLSRRRLAAGGLSQVDLELPAGRGAHHRGPLQGSVVHRHARAVALVAPVHHHPVAGVRVQALAHVWLQLLPGNRGNAFFTDSRRCPARAFKQMTSHEPSLSPCRHAEQRVLERHTTFRRPDSRLPELPSTARLPLLQPDQ